MNWEDREEGASKQLSGEEDTESRQGPPSTQNTEHRTQKADRLRNRGHLQPTLQNVWTKKTQKVDII